MSNRELLIIQKAKLNSYLGQLIDLEAGRIKQLVIVKETCKELKELLVFAIVKTDEKLKEND